MELYEKESGNLKASEQNKELLLNSLIKITNVEFNNLCENSYKSQSKLLKKAYNRTNSLRKIENLKMKYELLVPHEEYTTTIIPFLYKKVKTNPSVNLYRQASKYLEAYSFVKEAINDRLSTAEVEACFKLYTFEYFSKNAIR
ncbi:MAG: hypothetical protein E7J02_15005 [Staphylococcus warneri]|jgi:hypothetical protein|uniref:hypothetical protein n=1 Tax=Staphylococcus epidermidis TaxID=1282 RepID=UPI00024E20D8|nr:hypothetical protein [Staphylococcus epidermidis]MDU4504264.1 hypothetical protein [Staphylococcus warneri]EHR84383.1 hypothetical protein SEVCU120_2068 [Staphylococcus epidermidis VCU120]MCG2134987.1 hypothetical protein [Staphylococcus epidermidis]MDU5112477.1 hypothetical protein [Staphylococcus epidermidis]PIH06458.1 hypothetical protein CTJ00_12635 [Staphylococcus epidermidis]